jgi:hypothetical protein
MSIVAAASPRPSRRPVIEAVVIHQRMFSQLHRHYPRVKSLYDDKAECQADSEVWDTSALLMKLKGIRIRQDPRSLKSSDLYWIVGGYILRDRLGVVKNQQAHITEAIAFDEHKNLVVHFR